MREKRTISTPSPTKTKHPPTNPAMRKEKRMIAAPSTTRTQRHSLKLKQRQTLMKNVTASVVKEMESMYGKEP